MNNNSSMFIDILFTFAWIISVILIIYAGICWNKIYNEIENKSSKLLSYVFPVFLFKESILTEKGKTLRGKILLSLLILSLVVIAAMSYFLVRDEIL